MVGILTGYAEGGDIVCSAWKHAAVRKDGMHLATASEHKDFSTVVGTKRMPIKELEGFKSDILTITDEEKDLGYKHVFQTQPTKKTVGDRIRSPMGMFSKQETYMDNDANLLIKHLREYYGN